MKCDRCKIESASVNVKQIVGHTIVSLSLCAGCARKEGLDGQGDGAVNLLAVLQVIAQKAAQLDAEFDDDVEAKGAWRNATCPVCRLDGETYGKTGLLGCAHCYRTFASQLEPSLREMHRDTQHRGRGLVAGGTSSRLVGGEIAHLQEELCRAVATEAYEEAARLRDEIVALRDALQSKKLPVTQELTDRAL